MFPPLLLEHWLSLMSKTIFFAFQALKRPFQWQKESRSPFLVSISQENFLGFLCSAFSKLKISLFYLPVTWAFLNLVFFNRTIKKRVLPISKLVFHNIVDICTQMNRTLGTVWSMLCDLWLIIILQIFEWILWLLVKCSVGFFFLSGNPNCWFFGCFLHASEKLGAGSCYRLSHLSRSLGECLLAWRQRCLIPVSWLLQCSSAWHSKVSNWFYSATAECMMEPLRQYKMCMFLLGQTRKSLQCLLATPCCFSELLDHMLQRNIAFPMLAFLLQDLWLTCKLLVPGIEIEKCKDFHRNCI